MLSAMNAAARRLALVTAVALLMIGPSGVVAHAQTAPPNVPVIGCNGAATPLDADAETEDDGDSNGDSADAQDSGDDSDHAPPIVGSIKAPKGMKEDDKRLAPLAKISADQARDAALAVISDAKDRRVKSVSLESEQGYVVYAVKTVRTAPGGDPKLEVKVDAGNAAVLMMECDPNDD
jgi:uncharacterized membrane protein YkoI